MKLRYLLDFVGNGLTFHGCLFQITKIVFTYFQLTAKVVRNNILFL